MSFSSSKHNTTGLDIDTHAHAHARAHKAGTQKGNASKALPDNCSCFYLEVHLQAALVIVSVFAFVEHDKAVQCLITGF